MSRIDSGVPSLWGVPLNTQRRRVIKEEKQRYFNISKNEVVTRLFVNTADQDYILARIAHHGKMCNGFFWAAGQAIEKYLKASLLLNGKSSKGYGHNLVRLFEDVNQYASDLFPERLTEPLQFEGPFWQEETPLEFLERIKTGTDPNSRYNLFGYHLSREDLFHLDQFVFAARSVAFRLCSKHQRSSKDFLDKIAKADSNHILYDAALNYNFPFAPHDYKHKKTPLVYSRSESSVLSMMIGLPLEILQQNPISSHASAEDAESVAELADWIVKNIELPSCLSQDLCNARTILRKRATAFRKRTSTLPPKQKETE